MHVSILQVHVNAFILFLFLLFLIYVKKMFVYGYVKNINEKVEKKYSEIEL